MENFYGSILSIIAVSLFWGITNPFMKKGVVGLEKVQHASLLAQIGAEIWHLVKNWRYMVPFVLNQAGSLLFYVTISTAEISLAVPLANALTLVVTIFTGYLVGEKLNQGLICGMALVLVGVTLCISSKATNQ